MYLKEYLKSLGNIGINVYVDMDGVIADYIVGEPFDFDKKRPLFSSIDKLKEISQMGNVTLYILSVSKMTEGIKQKEVWLDKYAPFFKKGNRIIIDREQFNFQKGSIEIKNAYISQLKRDGSAIIVIDDDPQILKNIKTSNKDVITLKDTVLVD